MCCGHYRFGKLLALAPPDAPVLVNKSLNHNQQYEAVSSGELLGHVRNIGRRIAYVISGSNPNIRSYNIKEYLSWTRTRILNSVVFRHALWHKGRAVLKVMKSSSPPFMKLICDLLPEHRDWLTVLVGRSYSDC